MRSLQDFIDFASRLTNYELRSPPPRGNARERHRFNLASMRFLCERLAHPQSHPRHRVLVAGTHGKGSVCHWLDAILRGGGLRTGRYLSPHLVHLCERVRVDGEPLSEAAWVAAARQVIPGFEAAVSAGLHPTFFDLVTSLCFVAHREAAVDAAVLEVGLGGRLDSTNIVDPTVSVITEIDRDHTEILGNDLVAIAREKAGILRPGVPLLAQIGVPVAREAIVARAQEVGARPVVLLEPEAALQLQLPSPGAHQQRNAALALAVARQLGLAPTATQLAQSLQEAGPVPGRGQPVRAPDGQSWLLDGGHTAGAVEALVELLATTYRDREVSLVLGTAQDKDAVAICRRLRGAVTHLVVTPYDSPRATPAGALAQAARAAGFEAVEEATGVGDALHRARALAPPDPAGLRVVAGSFYLVGEILARRLLGELPA
jgi:dihydrofolate synthase/folylpolyglutamate synthase